MPNLDLQVEETKLEECPTYDPVIVEGPSAISSPDAPAPHWLVALGVAARSAHLHETCLKRWVVGILRYEWA